MKTTLTSYRFNTLNPEESKQYNDLVDHLKATPGRAPIFDVIGTAHAMPFKPVEIELETSFVTHNQWNTTDDSPNLPKQRVFDWYENISPSAKNYKQGHYLEITDEMRAIRQDTKKCGFCGKHYFLPTQPFCTACLSSEYLKEAELDLLQLMPAGAPMSEKRQLPDKDYAELQGLWLEAQTELSLKKLDKFKLKIKQDHSDAIRKANIRYNGYLKLIQINAPASEAIFYDHTETFTFGWQSALDTEVAKAILSKLKQANFPYLVDCKVKDGTLSFKPEGYKNHD